MKKSFGISLIMLPLLLVTLAQCSSTAMAPVLQGKTRVAVINGATAELCADPCTVTVIVNDTDDTVTARPDPVVVLPGQRVNWVAQWTSGSQARVKQVQFLATGEKKGATTSKHDHADASCLIYPFNRCTVDAKDFILDDPYPYFVKVKHFHMKTSDPEMVVAGTATLVDTVTTTGGH